MNVLMLLCFKLLLFSVHMHMWRKAIHGQSQNTVPIASTQVAIKGIVQYSTRTLEAWSQSRQLVTRHSQEHMLSAVGPDVHVE